MTTQTLTRITNFSDAHFGNKVIFIGEDVFKKSIEVCPENGDDFVIWNNYKLQKSSILKPTSVIIFSKQKALFPAMDIENLVQLIDIVAHELNKKSDNDIFMVSEDYTEIKKFSLPEGFSLPKL